VTDATTAAATPPAECVHRGEFDFHIEVNHLLPDGADLKDLTIPAVVVAVEITANCTACGHPMQFPGVPIGYSPDRPMTNVDGTALRIPMQPKGNPTPAGLPGFHVDFLAPPEVPE
jgi:hypothetical protein